MRRAVLLALALAAAGPAAAAQSAVPPRQRETGWRLGVHYGKWATAAAAAAFTVMAAHEHDHANRIFADLLALCRADIAQCTTGADGRYGSPTAEALYQSTLEYDRRARRRILAGQASLLATAALFLADLRQHASGPENKPFSPLEVSGDLRTGGVRVGLRLTF